VPEITANLSSGYDWDTDCYRSCHPDSCIKPILIRLEALRQYATSPTTPPDEQFIVYRMYWAIYSHDYDLDDFMGSTKVSRTLTAALDASIDRGNLEAEMFLDVDKRQLAEWLPGYRPVYCGDPANIEDLFIDTEDEVGSTCVPERSRAAQR
jgi:hypothetical protein